MAKISFHSIAVAIFLSLFIPCNCHTHLTQSNNHIAFFIFGDSFFDAGNNNYINTTTSFQANFFPYGETFFKYPTGRSSDGRLIPDFIADYAKLPLFPPYKQPGNRQFTNGVNFASAGAGALIETYRGMVIDLRTQLSYFKHVKKQLKQKLGVAEAKHLLSNAIYMVSIGNNDYLNPFMTNSSIFQSYSQEEYVEIVIGNMTDVIKEIYKKGGRKFGFVTVAPWGCLPLMKALKPGNTGGCIEEVTTILKLHNKVLFHVLQNLETQLKGFMYSLFNFYDAFSDRMDNPSKYGFKVGKTACCGSGPYRGITSCGGKRGIKEYELCANASEYVLFDSHPTEMANEQFAKLIWSGTSNIAWPCNLKALFERTLE